MERPILECIVICTTSHEIRSGKLNMLIDSLCEEEKNNLDLIVFVNNDSYKKQQLYKLYSSKFNKIFIVNLNIHPNDDVYIRSTSDKKIEALPKYGLKSGPNSMFFNIVRYCKHYDTILLLEYDCICEKNFILKCIDYIDKTPDFLISGSIYLGSVKIKKNIADHLNGVAFYRTGSPQFQNIINEVENFLIDENNKIEDYDVAYDVLIYSFMKKKYKNLINKNYITNNLIVNYSLPTDKDTSLTSIKEAHSECVIIHKKL